MSFHEDEVEPNKEKLIAIQKMRLKLRDKLLERLKVNPTIQDSETLRQLENDITFWEQQTDYTIPGLLKSLKESVERADANGDGS